MTIRFGAGTAGIVESAVRAWGFVVGFLYGALCLGYLALFATDQPESLLIATILIAPVLVAVALFIWGLVAWQGRRAWLVRLSAWCFLALSVILLISLSFLLIPLLLSAIPTLWPRSPSAGAASAPPT